MKFKALYSGRSRQVSLAGADITSTEIYALIEKNTFLKEKHRSLEKEMA